MKRYLPLIACVAVILLEAVFGHQSIWLSRAAGRQPPRTREEAYQTLSRIRQYIQVGMTGEEVRRIAGTAGIRLMRIGFINEPPGPGEEIQVPDTYSLSLGVPVSPPDGSSPVSMIVHVSGGRVDKVSPVSPPGP
ncbi:hypothetical protein [Azospirillum sp. B4]|uniref:hypothetical protein n=1 Tax=Azospirillum sp. B4 TaxID=95605 RepID=UPI00034DC701|nr:hypothetical protein [Azospirillum sp. B4]